MGRHADYDRLVMLAQVIRDNPGQRPGWYARQINEHNRSVMRCLYLLEHHGIQLAEDDRGRLTYVGGIDRIQRAGLPHHRASNPQPNP